MLNDLAFLAASYDLPDHFGGLSGDPLSGQGGLRRTYLADSWRLLEVKCTTIGNDCQGLFRGRAANRVSGQEKRKSLRVHSVSMRTSFLPEVNHGRCEARWSRVGVQGRGSPLRVPGVDYRSVHHLV